MTTTAITRTRRRRLGHLTIVQGPGPDGYGAIAARLSAVSGMDDNGHGPTYVLNP